MLQRFRKVSDNLFRSSAPNSDDIIWLNKKFGISRIISLDHKSSSKIALTCKLLGINHIDLSIDIGKKATLMRFLMEIEKLFQTNENTLIHCLWGRDRTGLACAIYRCSQDGWSAEKAIKEAENLDFGLELDPSIKQLYISIIENCAKDHQKKDANDANDIVENAREKPYNDYLDGSATANLSWAPYADRYVREYPMTEMDLNNGEANPLGGAGPSIIGDGPRSTTI